MLGGSRLGYVHMLRTTLTLFHIWFKVGYGYGWPCNRYLFSIYVNFKKSHNYLANLEAFYCF